MVVTSELFDKDDILTALVPGSVLLFAIAVMLQSPGHDFITEVTLERIAIITVLVFLIGEILGMFTSTADPGRKRFVAMMRHCRKQATFIDSKQTAVDSELENKPRRGIVYKLKSTFEAYETGNSTSDKPTEKLIRYLSVFTQLAFSVLPGFPEKAPQQPSAENRTVWEVYQKLYDEGYTGRKNGSESYEDAYRRIFSEVESDLGEQAQRFRSRAIFYHNMTVALGVISTVFSVTFIIKGILGLLNEIGIIIYVSRSIASIEAIGVWLLFLGAVVAFVLKALFGLWEEQYEYEYVQYLLSKYSISHSEKKNINGKQTRLTGRTVKG